MEKETARFQKKFLQETVSETMNFERNLSWKIMTMFIPKHCPVALVMDFYCCTKKEKKRGSLRFLLWHTRSVYDVGDMFTVSNQISNKREFFYLAKLFLVSFHVDSNTIALKVHCNAMQILCKN